jgi:hypothetical protein
MCESALRLDKTLYSHTPTSVDVRNMWSRVCIPSVRYAHRNLSFCPLRTANSTFHAVNVEAAVFSSILLYKVALSSGCATA